MDAVEELELPKHSSGYSHVTFDGSALLEVMANIKDSNDVCATEKRKRRLASASGTDAGRSRKQQVVFNAGEPLIMPETPILQPLHLPLNPLAAPFEPPSAPLPVVSPPVVPPPVIPQPVVPPPVVPQPVVPPPVAPPPVAPPPAAPQPVAPPTRPFPRSQNRRRVENAPSAAVSAKPKPAAISLAVDVVSIRCEFLQSTKWKRMK